MWRLSIILGFGGLFLAACGEISSVNAQQEPPLFDTPANTADFTETVLAPTPSAPTPLPIKVRVSAPNVSPSAYTSACAEIVDDIAQLDTIHRAFERTLLIYQKGELMTVREENGQSWSGDESFLPDITNPQLLVGGVRDKGFAISTTYQGEPFVEQPFVLVRPFIGNSTVQSSEVVKKVFNVFTGKECLVHYSNARAQLLVSNAPGGNKKKKKR